MNKNSFTFNTRINLSIFLKKKDPKISLDQLTSYVLLEPVPCIKYGSFKT